MIAHLRGEVLQVDELGAVVECAGVGYGVSMSRAALAQLRVGAQVGIWVHTHVSQEAIRLYGFVQTGEREAFLALVDVRGVGPRLALSVLSELAPSALAEAVFAGDLAALKAVAGVGTRTAERILLDLKDRLSALVAATPGQAGDGAEVGADAGAPDGRPRRRADAARLMADLASALLNVGFAPPVAQAAARQALLEAPGEEGLAALLRRALQTTHAPSGGRGMSS